MVRIAAVAVLAVAGACSSGNDDTQASDIGAATSEVRPPDTTAAGPFTLTALEFADGTPIPVEQACAAQGGSNTPPSLAWTGLPDGTASLALVADDPDAPAEGGFVHWVVVDLDPADGGVGGGVDVGTTGQNGVGLPEYFGPCPPAGAPHTYVFTLYAFSEPPDWPAEPTRDDVLAAAGGPTLLERAVLTGTFGS